MSLETKPKSAGSLIKFAIDLLSQQCWCWGQDILRPEGNWLMEIGLERIPPPEPYRERGSVYRCSLPHGGSILLRGFGVLIGRPESGGVFLPRYEFTPQHTSTWPLESLPWATAGPAAPEPRKSRPLRDADAGIAGLDHRLRTSDFEASWQ